MLPRFIVIALCLGMACAAVWRGRLPVKPKEFEDKEGCYVKEINDVISFGATVTPIGYCYRIDCGRHMMDYASCGTVGTSDSNCHVTEEDLSKPYPECCKSVKCDAENNID